MADEIGQAEISTYLGTQSDFDFEQSVLLALSGHGIPATYGGTYADPVTGKARQFDIRALKTYGDEIGVRMAIECKSLTPQYPLVVLRVPRPDGESVHEVIRSAGIANPDIYTGAMRCNSGRGVYRRGGRVGKKIIQIGWDSPKHNRLVSDDRDTYDKWTQALSSCAEFLEEAFLAHRKRGVDTFYTFVMPILVVSDGTLWVVDYSDVGAREGQPVQVEETTLFVDRRYELERFRFAYYIGHLHIYTLTGFRALLNDLVTPGGNSPFRELVFSFLTRDVARG